MVEVAEPVRGGHRFVALAVAPIEYGASAACGIDDAAVARCWGRNTTGQLGLGDSLDRAEPTAVTGLPLARAITAPQRTTCALDAAGSVWCWGENDAGQVNPGANSPAILAPAVPAPALRFRAVANSWLSACGVASDGALWCWGEMSLPRLNGGEPRRVAVDTAFVELASNGITIFGRTSAGEVYFWAEYEGDGFAATPERLAFPVPITSLSAGRFPVRRVGDGVQGASGVCGIGADAQVYCAAPSYTAPPVWRLTSAGMVPAGP
jgi:hypothetical protein